MTHVAAVPEKNTKTAMVVSKIKSLRVVVAIITNTNAEVLITRRSFSAQHPGKWELPGGKVEPNESESSALYREIHEELGIQIEKATWFTEIKHSYPDKTVTLAVYLVNSYLGEPKCLESQIGILWVAPKDITNYEFPAANYPLIKLIKQHQNARLI